MEHDVLIKQLMATYVDELDESVRTFNRTLLELEKTTPGVQRDALLKELFRTAHSLKGASRSVSVRSIETACHRLEGILAALRSGDLALGAPLQSLLFETADVLESAGQRLRRSEEPDTGEIDRLVKKLEAAAVSHWGQGRRSTPESVILTAPETSSGPCTAVGTGQPEPSTPPPAKAGRLRPPAGPAVLPSGPRGGSAPAIRAGGQLALPDAGTRPALLVAPPVTPDLAVSAEPHIAAADALPATNGEPVAHDTAPAVTVRLASEKLDALLNSTGELSVALRRLFSQLDELQELREMIAEAGSGWLAADRFLRRTALRQSSEPRPARSAARRLAARFTGLLDATSQTLHRAQQRSDALTVGLVENGRVLKQVAGDLEDQVRRARMLPFAQTCLGIDRLVHDLSREAGKEVELVVSGGEVDVDRSLVEGLKDPLRHLVRNAIDHGAEGPRERQTLGKPPQVRVTVAAVLRGSQVEVSVADDGRGIDLDALRAALREHGLAVPAAERELQQTIFITGVTTAKRVTDVSGRGLGLDIVKHWVESQQGTVDVWSAAGRGTRFELLLPLTLGAFRALVVRAAGQTFAVISTHIRELLRMDPTDLKSIEGRLVLMSRGTPVPVVSLAETLGLAPPQRSPERARVPLLVLEAARKRVGLLVEELVSEQEITIKGLGARIQRLAHFSGATILPSGGIALVVNTEALIRSALGHEPSAPGKGKPPRRKRLLLVEDSVTTRMLMARILEEAGYEVAQAPDGGVAWEHLEAEGADLVVSDVAMPHKDGFALTEAVRASSRFRDLPVVLVTARETAEDRARGLSAGANAYLLKSEFDQRNLLETIGQLL